MKTKTITWSDFSYALKTPFVLPSSKNLIKKAVEGDLVGYGKALAGYHWTGTRDYTMTMIAMTPIILAKNAKDAECEKWLNEIPDHEVRELFRRIGMGEGSQVKRFIENPKRLGKYKSIFVKALDIAKIDGAKQVKVWADFTKQLGKIKEWKFSDVKPLIKLVDDTFSGQVAGALEDGANKGGKPEGELEREPEREPQKEESRKEEPKVEKPKVEEPKPELPSAEATREKLLNKKAYEAEDFVVQGPEEQQKDRLPFLDKKVPNLPKRLPEMFNVLRRYALDDKGIKSAEEYVLRYANNKEDADDMLKELNAVIKCGKSIVDLKYRYVEQIIKDSKIKKSVVMVPDLLAILPSVSDHDASVELYNLILEKTPDSYFKESVVKKINPGKWSVAQVMGYLGSWLPSLEGMAATVASWGKEVPPVPEEAKAPMPLPRGAMPEKPGVPEPPKRADLAVSKVDEKLQHKLIPKEKELVKALFMSSSGKMFDAKEWDERTDGAKRVILGVRALQNNYSNLNRAWDWDECLKTVQKDALRGIYIYVATLLVQVMDPDGQQKSEFFHFLDKDNKNFADKLREAYEQVFISRSYAEPKSASAPNAKPKFRELYETLRKIGVKDLATAERQVMSVFGVKEGKSKNKKLRLLAKASEKLAANKDVKDFMKAINTRSPGQLVESVILCADIESALRTIYNTPANWKDLCDANRYEMIYNALEASLEGDSKYKTKHVLRLKPNQTWKDAMNAADAAYSKGIWNKFGIGKLWDMAGWGANVLEAHMATPRPDYDEDTREIVDEYLTKQGKDRISDEESPLIGAFKKGNYDGNKIAKLVLWIRRGVSEGILSMYNVAEYAQAVDRSKGDVACSYLADVVALCASSGEGSNITANDWLELLKEVDPSSADRLKKLAAKDLKENTVIRLVNRELVTAPLAEDESEFVRRYAKKSRLQSEECAAELVPIIKGLRVIKRSVPNRFNWGDVFASQLDAREYANGLLEEMEPQVRLQCTLNIRREAPQFAEWLNEIDEEVRQMEELLNEPDEGNGGNA